MKKKRMLIITLIIAAAGIVLCGVNPSSASEMLVEIFYLPHRPAEAVVSDVKAVLESHQEFEVRTYSFEDPGSRKLLKRYGLTGHMPVAIFINGKNEFPVAGRSITLRNFPRGNAFVPTFEGEWSYQDLEQILQSLSGNE